jgi:glutathione S-transferase
VESIIDLKNDQDNKIAMFKWVLEDEEALKQWASSTLPDKLKLIEARLVANGGGDGFFVGDSATWADYSLFQFLHDRFYLHNSISDKASFEAATPKLKAFVDRFLANDSRLQEWIAVRPVTSF